MDPATPSRGVSADERRKAVNAVSATGSVAARICATSSPTASSKPSGWRATTYRQRHRDNEASSAGDRLVGLHSGP